MGRHNHLTENCLAFEYKISQVVTTKYTKAYQVVSQAIAGRQSGAVTCCGCNFARDGAQATQSLFSVALTQYYSSLLLPMNSLGIL